MTNWNMEIVLAEMLVAYFNTAVMLFAIVTTKFKRC